MENDSTRGGGAFSSGFDVDERDRMAMLGAVRSDAARVWFRAGGAGAVRVRCSARSSDWSGEQRIEVSSDDDHTGACTFEGLSAGERLHFEVTVDGESTPFATLDARTPPRSTANGPIAIGVMSCNMPFAAHGVVDPRATRALANWQDALRSHDAIAVFSVGDQLYADLPRDRSLYDEHFVRRVLPVGRASLAQATDDEIRRVFHARYRAFWSVPGWEALHRSFPVFPIWDDHEVVDNWRSEPDHFTPEWQRIGAAARRAYIDYQASRMFAPRDPASDAAVDSAVDTAVDARAFDYGFDYGDLAVYTLDLRSERRIDDDACVISPAQFERLEAFLAARSRASVVAIVSSVPFAHVPSWVARTGARLSPSGGDFADRWATVGHQADRRRLLALLDAHRRRHAHQAVILLTGDIHVAGVQALAPTASDETAMVQVISSPVTNATGPLVRLVSAMSFRATRRLPLDGDSTWSVRSINGTSFIHRNPYRGLNGAVLEFAERDGASRAFRITIYGLSGRRPRVVYRTRWLEPGVDHPPSRSRQ